MTNRRHSVSVQHYGLSNELSEFGPRQPKRKRKRSLHHEMISSSDYYHVKRHSLSTNGRRGYVNDRTLRLRMKTDCSRRDSCKQKKKSHLRMSRYYGVLRDESQHHHPMDRYDLDVQNYSDGRSYGERPGKRRCRRHHLYRLCLSSMRLKEKQRLPRRCLNACQNHVNCLYSYPKDYSRDHRRSPSSSSPRSADRFRRRKCLRSRKNPQCYQMRERRFRTSLCERHSTSRSGVRRHVRRKNSSSFTKERLPYHYPCVRCRRYSSFDQRSPHRREKCKTSATRIDGKHKHISGDYQPRHYRDHSGGYPSHSSLPANNPPSNSDIVHFNWYPGMSLGKRFRVRCKLGEGTFGRVLECVDLRHNEVVAVKVVRDVSRYTRSAKIEADILRDIKALDPERRSNCVILVDQYLYDACHRRSCTSASAMRSRKGCHRYRRNRSHYGSCPPKKKAEPRCQRTNHSHDSENSNHARSSSSHLDEYAKGVHMCLASEKLGLSLYAFLTQNKYHGFFVADIRRIAYEALKALSFLRKIKLTHTDLKPENILFIHDGYERVLHPRSCYSSHFWNGDCSDSELDESPNCHYYTERQCYKSTRRTPEGKGHNCGRHCGQRGSHRSLVMTKRPLDSRVKLIDFGSATYEDDEHTTVINTRQYRAPEVIFQIGWSTPSDMWCLGCILVELYTGVLLFRTHEHFEHLAMIEKIVCPFSQSVLRSVSHSPTAHYLAPRSHPDEEYRLDWPHKASSEKSIQKVAKCRRLESMFLPCHKLLADFVKFILVPDQNLRPTPREALAHPFITTSLPEA